MPPNRGGRPRTLEEPGSKLSFYVRCRDRDRLTEIARREGLTISALVRKVLTMDLREWREWRHGAVEKIAKPKK